MDRPGRRTRAAVARFTIVILTLNAAYWQSFRPLVTCTRRQSRNCSRDIKYDPMPPSSGNRSVGINNGDRKTLAAYWDA